MTYADKTQLIADYIPGAKSTNEIAAVERILENVSAFVDTYCRRPSGYFLPSPEEPRMLRVRGEGTHFLRLPVHIFDSVTVEGFETNDYYESEKNGWLYFESEEFGNENGFADDYPRIWIENRTYKVTARWGYVATPLDIQEAVREIVKRIWEAQKGTLGQITPNGFVIERAMPLLAKEVLDRYRRREFEI